MRSMARRVGLGVGIAGVGVLAAYYVFDDDQHTKVFTVRTEYDWLCNFLEQLISRNRPVRYALYVSLWTSVF